ncbi:MAG: phosphodiesterase [Erysipelotrichaceae bacterium]|nr:phosphodiesterase [Erysipelotrichaceae bacterium]
MKDLLFALDKGSTIFFAILILLAMCGLCALLLLSIIKGNKKHSEDDNEHVESGYISKNQLISSMNYFIRRFRFESEMSLFLIELDNAKSLRDTFGEKQYSHFYKALTKKIFNTLPKNSLVCNMGNDQLAILLRGTLPVGKIQAFADSLMNLIQAPVSISSIETSRVAIDASMGIVIYPVGGANAKDLLKNADMALYMCKKDTSKNYVIFSNNIDKTEKENMEYYHQIKDAMRNKEFTLVYQPIIDTKTNEFIGCEALIRWVHPTLGVLSPNKFLNIMEHTGDITWVGKWGIEVICSQYLEWQKNEAFANKNFMISFNLSPKQLLDPQIALDFQSIVKRYRVDPHHICLEIVEFAMFEKYGIIGENIQKLHNIGFSIAIDDFGLDVNSLARISSLPLDIIKFEKDFVSVAQENYMMTKVVNMLVDFANEKQKLVIAEGVETLQAMEKINSFGISCMQGYLFSRPISSAQMTQYVLDEQWKINIPKNDSATNDETSEENN